MPYVVHYIFFIALCAPNPTLAFVHSQLLSPRHIHGSGIPQFSPIYLHVQVRNVSLDQSWPRISGKNENEKMNELTNLAAYPSITGPEIIYLRPRGSRTVNTKGEGSISTRTFVHLSSEVVGIWPALFLLGNFLATSALFLVYMFSSLRSLWRTFEATANAWQCFLFGIDNISLCIAELVFLFAWICMVSAIRGLCLGLIYTLTVVRECISRIHFFLERRRIRQWEYQTRERIRRKSPKNVSHKVTRGSAKYSDSPLFSRESLDSLTYLLLPEEGDVLARHMYDPRYFNKVKNIGAGAFGSILLVEHRITGKLMAMKVLLRSENTSDEVDLEVRAMMRLQGKPWYPKLLSTFMDTENFYILMVCFINHRLFLDLLLDLY